MDSLQTVFLALGASWLSGIRLYAVVAMMGILGRFAGFELPGDLEILKNEWVIGVASVLTLAEFVADKVPAFDTVWDAIHTFIRIPAAAALALAAVGDFDPVWKVIAALIGGTLALGSHTSKASVRAVVNTSPEPVSNVAVSAVEDVYAATSSALVVMVPILGFVLVLAGIAFAAWWIPKAIKLAKKALSRKAGSL